MPLQVPRPNTLPVAHPTSRSGNPTEAAGEALCRDMGFGLARAFSGVPYRQQGLGFSRGLAGAASVASCDQQGLDKRLPWPCQDEGGRAAVSRRSGTGPAPPQIDSASFHWQPLARVFAVLSSLGIPAASSQVQDSASSARVLSWGAKPWQAPVLSAPGGTCNAGSGWGLPPPQSTGWPNRYLSPLLPPPPPPPPPTESGGGGLRQRLPPSCATRNPQGRRLTSPPREGGAAGTGAGGEAGGERSQGHPVTRWRCRVPGCSVPGRAPDLSPSGAAGPRWCRGERARSGTTFPSEPRAGR